jgi:hypothetical protein
MAGKKLEAHERTRLGLVTLVSLNKLELGLLLWLAQKASRAESERDQTSLRVDLTP